MKLTKVQIATILCILAYLVYEFIFVARWKNSLPDSDPVIRADLILILPVLGILILVSLIQLIRTYVKK